MARGDIRNIHETKEVSEKTLEGARKVAEAVAATYGAVSGNVRIEKSYGGSTITKDGVTVAQNIVLNDKVEDMGAESLIEASQKSNAISGDGTSATVILGYHIMKKAYERVAAGANAMQMRRGIELAALSVKEELDKQGKTVKSDEELKFVATISASDEEVGKLVADTVSKVGGVGITVEEYDGLGVIQDVVEGTYFEKGYALPHFVTDRETQEAVHENINVLLLEKRIKQNQDIIPLIEMVGREAEHKSLLVIGNVSDQALQTCALTNLQGGVKILVVTPPVYGDMVVPFLEDMAILTGGKLVPSEMPPDRVDSAYLGFAKKVISAADHTTILDGQGVSEDVKMRIDTIKKQLNNPKYSEFQRERLAMRLSKMQGKVGIIRVGGATEIEAKETKFRVEDAINATRSAQEGGILAGGAVPLARLSTMEAPEMSKDEAAGYEVVVDALAEPFKQLMENAGEDGGYRLQQVLRAEADYGFNVKDITDTPVDLFEEGIIDPVLVIKSVVENACSAAGIAITSKMAISIDREEQRKNK